MILKTTKTLANFLDKEAQKHEKTKNYHIYKTEMTERAYAFNVDIDPYDHENDYNINNNKYNVIVIEYPQNYYACNKYITTNDLHKSYNKSDKTLNGFIKKFIEYIEI